MEIPTAAHTLRELEKNLRIWSYWVIDLLTSPPITILFQIFIQILIEG